MHYRLHIFGDGEGIHRTIDIVCATERHAIETARAHLQDHRMELWCGPSLVRTFLPTRHDGAEALRSDDRNVVLPFKPQDPTGGGPSLS